VKAEMDIMYNLYKEKRENYESLRSQIMAEALKERKKPDEKENI